MAYYYEQLFIVAVERTERDPDRKPALNETYVAHTCGDCHAIVRDTASHDRWHLDLERQIAAAAGQEPV